MLRKYKVVGLSVALAITARAQAELAEVIVDHYMRPGAHFATIQAGIDAVAPGGCVFVRQYPNYSEPNHTLDIGKPLYLLAGGHPYSPTAAQRVGFGGRIRIHGIGPGEEVVIDGISKGNFGTASTDEILDCAGRVRLSRTSIGGIAVPGVGARIHRCANVHFYDCGCYGGIDPLEVVDSNVVFEFCIIRPGLGFVTIRPGTWGLLAGPGADITLIRTGVSAFQPFAVDPQRPLLIDGGIVRVDARSGLIGSTIAPVAWYRYPNSTGTVWLDPGAQLQHGPVIASPGLLHQIPVRSVDATEVSEGGSYTATLRGAQPGDAFGVILAGPATPSPFPLAGLTLSQGVDPDYTLAWLDPSTASVLYFGAPSGTSAPTSVGSAPAYSDIVLQGAFLRTDGTVVLTPPFSQWVQPPDMLWR